LHLEDVGQIPTVIHPTAPIASPTASSTTTTSRPLSGTNLSEDNTTSNFEKNNNEQLTMTDLQGTIQIFFFFTCLLIVAVLKACLDFSVETDLQKLVQNLLWVVIQYAGASRGTLILCKESGEEWDEPLSVSTDSHPQHYRSHTVPPTDPATNPNEDNPYSEDNSEPHESPDDNDTSVLMVGGNLKDLVPLSMLNYVTRTREMCVLNNLTSHEGMFSSDEYFQSFTPKDVLMFPIIHQVPPLPILFFFLNFEIISFLTSISRRTKIWEYCT
jgi:hypothetical protein